MLDPIITEDVKCGCSLPLPIAVLNNIPNASLAPLGCHKKDTINEAGIKIPKYRMTHDQSFTGPSGLSVNLRVNKESLPPIMYCFVLIRSIHYICSLHQHHPSKKIFLCKVDLDAAYWRCHLSSSDAHESLTTYDILLFMVLRMTFGGVPCPAMWGYISDTLADVCNCLIHNPCWDHNNLFDTLSNRLGMPQPLPDSLPFHQAKPMSVKIPPNDFGKVDIYNNDTIGIAPDIHDNATRVSRSIPLVIHALARPLDPSDQLPRKDIISLKKIAVEGQLEETKLILGWIINTRSLSISLPKDKFQCRTSNISRLSSSSKAKHKTLESTIGHLNHVACIYSPMRHFMGHLYQAQYRASKSGWTSLTTNEKMDLHLLLSFLKSAFDGLSMNNLTFQKPTNIYRSDASEFSLGGYNIISGKVWHYKIPVDC
jgi:hypothetical protein